MRTFNTINPRERLEMYEEELATARRAVQTAESELVHARAREVRILAELATARQQAAERAA